VPFVPPKADYKFLRHLCRNPVHEVSGTTPVREFPNNIPYINFVNKNDFVRLAKFSESVRDSTLKRLNLVPAGRENFRYKPNLMSFADVALHLIDIDRSLIKLPAKSYASHIGNPDRIHISKRSQYERLLNELQRLKTVRSSFIKKLGNGSINKKVNVTSLSGKSIEDTGYLIYKLLDHEIHHRGQLVVYLKFVV
jgi:uncharacterized damage-inducible protein DinB